MKYECPRCGYETDHKGSMKSHFHRKTHCKPLLSDIKLTTFDNIFQINTTNVCSSCDKSFLNNSNRKRHEKICQEKENEEKEKKQLELKNHLLEERIKELEKNQHQTVNNIQNITNNITNNIVILPFNETDVSHLRGRDYMLALDRCVLSVKHLIGDIHFNPDKPENHNIFISNISKNYAMVWDGKDWVVKDQTDVVDDLIRENEYRLEDWVENGGKKYPKAMKKFKLYTSKRDEKGVPEMVRKEVKMMMYNNRDMIKEVK
jgi:hypothetical protein